MNVPISTACRAPTRRVNTVMNAPCSGEICIIAIGSCAVSSINACCTASGGVPCATTYSWISGVRKNDLGAAMAPTL